MAKSVPQRMAIISAGVIMNVIFAVVFATIGYRLGVPYTPPVVGGLTNGGVAWLAGLQVGDEIVEVNGVKKPRFIDLIQEISTADLSDGVKVVIQRPACPSRSK